MSQTCQIVALPCGPSVAGDYAITTARYNAPTAGTRAAINLWDGLTLAAIPRAARHLTLDGDCRTWRTITTCVALPVGTTHLNLDLLFTNGTLPQGGFVDEAYVYVCSRSDCVTASDYNANPNSTGIASSICVSGSAVASDNNLTLIATDLPPNVFGFFITSATQGFIMNPAGSAGNLCLAGATGR